MLFKPDVVYPSDDVGPYIELKGKIVHAVHSGALVELELEGKLQRITVYNDFIEERPSLEPKPETDCTVRLYNSGGGWYPDDKLVSWTGVSGTLCQSGA